MSKSIELPNEGEVNEKLNEYLNSLEAQQIIINNNKNINNKSWKK